MKNKVDSIWDTIWTGGITSPVTVLEQITYLMFMKLLDDNQLKAEANANLLGVPLKNKVFQDGTCVISENPRVETEYKNLRWNVFHNFEPGEMLTNIQTYVFPFIKTIGEGKDTAFSRYMKDTVFLIPTAKVLAKVVDGIDAMDMNNKDIMGDVYEYLLGKIAAAGENGQFRTPRHIINMMVELMQPTLKDSILDPAMGSAGFLLSSAAYISEHQKKELMKTENMRYFKSGLFSGFDTDQSIVIPTVIAIPGATRYSQRGFSLGPVNLNRGAWRTLLLWLVLSRIGTDVLDEWVFGFQGAWRGG